jgi:hypothetical protein
VRARRNKIACLQLIFIRVTSNVGETAMTIARIILAGTAAFIVSSAALAEQGMVTKIDRLTHTISIQPMAPAPSGTVGANTGGTAGPAGTAGPTGPAQDFKAQDNLSLDDVHVGDRVNYAITQTGAAKTITKLERQK